MIILTSPIAGIVKNSVSTYSDSRSDSPTWRLKPISAAVCVAVLISLSSPASAEIGGHHYVADHDSMWSEVFHTIMGGGGRTIMAGDSLTIQNGATVTFDFVKEHEFTIAGYGSLIFGADYNQSTKQNEAELVRVVADGEKGTLVGITDPNDGYANAGIWTYAKDLKKGEPDIDLENINVDLENYYYGFRADGGSITLRSGGFVKMRNSESTGLYSLNDGLIDLELDSLKIDNAQMGIRSRNNAGSKVSSDSLTILNVECGILGSDDGWVNLSNNQTNIQASRFGISLSDSADVTIKNSRLLQISAGQNSRRDDGSSVYAGGVSSVNIDLTREGEKTTSDFKGFLYSVGQTGGENTATITVNSRIFSCRLRPSWLLILNRRYTMSVHSTPLPAGKST